MMSFFPSPSFSLSKKRNKTKNNSSKKNVYSDNDDKNMATTIIVSDSAPFRSTHYGLGYHLDSMPIVDTNVNNDLTFERRVLKSPTKPLQQDRVSSVDTSSINSLGHSRYDDDVDDSNNNYNINRLHDISSPLNTKHLSQQKPTSDHSHHRYHHDQSKFSTETKRRRSSALLHFIRGFISPDSMNIQRYVQYVVLFYSLLYISYMNVCIISYTHNQFY